MGYRVVVHFLVAGVVLLAGCGETDSDGSDSPSLSGRCSDCVEVISELVLGDPSLDAADESFVEEAIHLVVDQTGRFWVGQPEGIKLFGSDGSYEGAIGRLGRGPGEFSYRPGPLESHGNAIFVFDPGNARVSRYSETGEFESGVRLEAGVNAATVLGDTTFAVATRLMDTDLLEVPIHVFEAPQRAASFGRPAHHDSISNYHLRRRLTSTPDGEIIAAYHYEDRIEIWSRDGELRRVFDGPLDWDDTYPTSGVWTDESPPPNLVRDIALDSTGRLWALRRIRQEDWRSNMREEVTSDGTVRLLAAGSTHDVFDSQIDVIDLETGEVVGSGTSDISFYGFAGPRVVFANTLTSDGVPQILIAELAIRSEASHP